VKFVDSKEAPVGNWLASVGPGEDPVAVGVMGVAARNPVPSPHDKLNPKRGYLGIVMKKGEKGGVQIDAVSPRTPASRAGLKSGDLILTVNGKEITDAASMQETMNKTKSGDEVTIKVKRGSDEKDIKVKLGSVPPDQSDFQNKMGTDVAPLSERRTGFPTIFQHDGLVPAKDCGGPVVDLDGHVVGINIARAGRTETDAIPSEAIRPLLADLESGKLAPKEDTEKKVAELKTALKKAEEDMAAAEKSLGEAQEALKKQEAAKAEAEQKLKEAKEALEKAEKEAKEKK
jgi:serine protease Do